jgi:hypothetical protein
MLDTNNFPENDGYMFRMYSSVSFSVAYLDYEIYIISSVTPKGCWVVSKSLNHLDDVKKYRKFIRNDGKKKFAYPTREEARLAFCYRKRSQITILERQLEKARISLATAGGEPYIKPSYLNTSIEW